MFIWRNKQQNWHISDSGTGMTSPFVLGSEGLNGKQPGEEEKQEEERHL